MLVYGRNVAKEYLNKIESIHKVYLLQSFHDEFIKSALQKAGIAICYGDKRRLDQLVSGNHQGIILDVADFQYTDFTTFKDKSFLVVLDHLEDPHNFGAILRTCEAAGVDGVMIPKDRSVEVNATVIKASAGASEFIDIAQVTNLVQSLKELKKNGFWVIGTDMQGSDYRTLDYEGKIVLVIGSEGKGMSRLVEEQCDFVANIPMTGRINSLNASVAAALVIFEAVRLRK